MILSNNYVIRDILHTVRSRRIDEIRRICDKYMERYKNDKDLTGVCSMVSTDFENIPETDFNEIELRLEELLSVNKF
jgi:hypothetical protein